MFVWPFRHLTLIIPSQDYLLIKIGVNVISDVISSVLKSDTSLQISPSDKIIDTWFSMPLHVLYTEAANTIWHICLCSSYHDIQSKLKLSIPMFGHIARI